ncbi:MAG: sterol desaturase family protein [Segetibacter sp.]
MKGLFILDKSIDCMLEKLAQYFEHIPSAHRTLFLAGGICFFWLVESAQPLFTFRYHKIKHAGVNFLFTFTTLIVNLAFAFLIVRTSDFTNQNNVGLLHLIKMPLWATLITGLLLMDLISAYLIHWIEHKVKWMWKFHMIHHADTYVDTTTANRHHPGESVFRAAFTTLAVLICGAPIWVVMLYQTLSALFRNSIMQTFNSPSG